MIRAGRVEVDGKVIKELGTKVDPLVSKIRVDRKEIGKEQIEQTRKYIALHKPAGVVSTVADKYAETTVVDLVPRDLVEGARLVPVGRLDADSEGLIFSLQRRRFYLQSHAP